MKNTVISLFGNDECNEMKFFFLGCYYILYSVVVVIVICISSSIV